MTKDRSSLDIFGPSSRMRESLSSGQKVRIPMPPRDPSLGLTDADQDMVIEARWPLSESQWEYLMSVMAAMKPGLVQDPERY